MKYLFIKIKYRLQLLKIRVVTLLGFEDVLLKNRYGEQIIVFHGIDKTGETKYNSRFVSESYFEKFISYITIHFNVISLEDYYAKKFKANTLNIAITFDDGYFNNYKYAIPILKKYKVPASFYITTVHEKHEFLWPDFIDLVSFYSRKQKVVFDQKEYKKNTKGEFSFQGTTLKTRCKEIKFEEIELGFEMFKDEWDTVTQNNLTDYWQLMNALEIQEIAKHVLFTVGAHGNTHVNLTKIPLHHAKQEIHKSKQILEKICKTSIDEFAFPFGYYNDTLLDYAKEIGFTKILLVGYNQTKDKEDEILQNRFVINPYISEKEQLYFLLKGSYY